MALESWVVSPPMFTCGNTSLIYFNSDRRMQVPLKSLLWNERCPFQLASNCISSGNFRGYTLSSRCQRYDFSVGKAPSKSVAKASHGLNDKDGPLTVNFEFLRRFMKHGIVIAAMVCGVLVYGSKRVFAEEGIVNAGYDVLGHSILLLRNAWPKTSQVLQVFKEQGLVLAALLGLSAFFSMAETSITTLWPWKVRELAEKESENGLFRMLRSDVTRFLTTILIGTTVVNIGATALVTEAATALFGEAGVSAATGVMTVAILLLTEITPKSIAVHNATEVARFVVRPVAWLSLILYPVGRVVTYLSMGMLKLLGLKGRSEPYVTEEELKLMLRGAELSGAIEEEEQDYQDFVKGICHVICQYSVINLYNFVYDGVCNIFLKCTVIILL